MGSQRTLAIIKPDAVGRGISADILSRIHAAKFQIVAIKSMRLTKAASRRILCRASRAAFFKDLTEFMSSGKVVVMVLEAEGAIAKWRDTMGATDPAKAAPGTIRKELGTSIQIQLHARFGRAGNRRLRDQLFLRRRGTRLAFAFSLAVRPL